MENKSVFTGTGSNGQAVKKLVPETSVVEGTQTGVAREFHNFVADIEDLVKATTSLTGEDLARAKVKIVERVTAAKHTVEEMSGVIADRARHTVKVTDGYVHAQPWQAVGIGAAAGLLIGFLLARRA